ncbi:MAG: glycosyltransferase [Candidatus Omnitrophica bacterium]|nr:glycosyltransferase [Candidatus Omnitrophota bacterium]
MSIRISSIICTYNRQRYLRKAVQSLVEQTLPNEQYEIIVVDNGSSDDTKRVIKRLSNIQNLRYIYDPTLGLSQARNTGWINARGEYIAYLDDDAMAFPQWLEKILEVFENVKPKPGCAGGRIELIWETPRPNWISDKLLPALGKVNWSQTPIFINKDQWIPGGNCAFPRGLLESMGGFSVDLGRKGGNLLCAEEIQLQNRLNEKGYRCFYHPEIAIRHHVLPLRLSKKWFLRKSFGQGVSDAVINLVQDTPFFIWRFWKGVTTLLNIVLSPRELSTLLLPTDNPDRFVLKCSIWARLGHVLKLWGIAK